MSLYRSFATVGGLTLISRVLGFVRDQLIAYVLGTGAVADAFIVAFRIPNLFRRLFAEGAFNSAFVPLFAERLEGKGHAEAKQFAEEALAGLSFVLILFTILAIVFMPYVLPLIASGFVGDQAKFDLTVLLTRLAFPYLLCMSLMALYSGVLSSLRQFAAASAAQILLNIVLTIVMGIAWWLGFSRSPQAGIILASAVTLAGILQLAMLARDSARHGMALSLRLPRWTPGMQRLVTLGIPALIAGGILQLNSIIGTNIASWQPGANSFLYYADRLYQLPLGIVGIAIGVVLLPDIARLLRAGELAQVAESQNRSTEFALLLTLPAAVALAVIPLPIIQVLFERGAFTAADTPPTAYALAAFAWGLPAFVLNKVLSPAFFAREDTKTPMRFALVNLLINSAGSIGLFFYFQHLGWMPHVGIAIATSVAAWINVAQLWLTLRARGHFTADARLKRNLPLVLLSSVAMGVVLWFAGAELAPWLQPKAGALVQVGTLGGLVMLGLVVYALAVQLTGIADWRAVLRQLRSPRRRAAAAVDD
jgi:putative peptidoglycan lipid II flippase